MFLKYGKGGGGQKKIPAMSWGKGGEVASHVFLGGGGGGQFYFPPTNFAKHKLYDH